MKQGKIVVLGSVNCDLVLRCAPLPVAGQTVHGRDFRRLPGGKGANQAVAAARMGAAVSFVGAVGDDDDGRAARANLVAQGVDVSYLRTVQGVATGTAMILVDDASGQNCIALYDGANAQVDVALVEAAAGEIAGAALLICQLETPPSATLHAARIARGAGVPVLLNPAPAMPLDPALIELVDLLVPNESEAMLLAGQQAGETFDEVATVDALHALGAQSVLVTLGADGVLFSERGAPTRTRYNAHPAQAVDTSGAGDAFIGALGASLLAGIAPGEAIDRAQRAASISVTRQGAMASLPFGNELGLA